MKWWKMSDAKAPEHKVQEADDVETEKANAIYELQRSMARARDMQRRIKRQFKNDGHVA